MSGLCVSAYTVYDVFPLQLDACCTVQAGTREPRPEVRRAFGERDEEKERKGNVLEAASTGS